MQKLLLFTFIFLSLSLDIYAQEIDLIKAWQQKHPDVVFVSNDNYHQMSPEERKILVNKEVIFFTGEITMNDIYSFETLSNEKTNLYIHDETDYVKQWIANHPDVKIIKNSVFQNANPILQMEYVQCDYCVILTNEELTTSDIERFEQDKH